MNRLFYFAVTCILWIGPLLQSGAQTFDHRTMKRAIRQIADTIARDYVFPNKRKEISNQLLQRMSNGNYDSIGSWKSFASVLSNELRVIAQDNHMYLSLKHPGAIPVTPSGSSTETHFDRSRENNYGFEKVEILAGNVGYCKISEINFPNPESVEVFQSVIRFLQFTTGLILDLRGNGGGGSDMGPLLETWLLEKDKPLLCFTSIYSSEMKCHRVPEDNRIRKRTEVPVMLLVDRKTGSAAEAFVYALRQNNRALVIGERTNGAAHMNTFYGINPVIDLSVSTGAPLSPVTNANWEGKGIEPDISCDPGDALSIAQSKIRDLLLRKDK